MRATLHPDDLRRVCGRVPKDIRDLMITGRFFIGGGFTRAVIAGESPNDIDVFGYSKIQLEAAAVSLGAQRPGNRTSATENAITMVCPPRIPVQFITKWLYADANTLLDNFDFTICQSVIWRDHGSGAWQSMVSSNFYTDLASRRLRYTCPIREEAPGGSMMRVLKYLKRGYHISPHSLGKVITRLTQDIDVDKANEVRNRIDPGKIRDPITLQEIIIDRLREVDPLRVIDGVETEDADPDHEEAV